MDIFGFWIFLSVIGGGTLWSTAARRRLKHETLRALIEKGHGDDESLINKILDSGSNKLPSLQLSLRIVGVMALFAGSGLALMALIVTDAPSTNGLLATASLCASLGIGFFVAAALATRASGDEISG